MLEGGAFDRMLHSLGRNIVLGTVAVSYTHLDVYKRQPFVQIDHILARGLTVTGAGSEVIAGTDHALVWASWR